MENGKDVAIDFTPVKPDAHYTPPKNRSRSKTIYLDKNSTSELREELTQDLKYFSTGSADPHESPKTYRRVRGRSTSDQPAANKSAEAIARANSPLTESCSYPTPLIPMPAMAAPERDVPVAASATVPESTGAQRKLALHTIMKPEPAVPAAIEPAAVAPALPMSCGEPDSPIVGFLVSFDKKSGGDAAALRIGRAIVTSDPGARGSQALVVEDPSVSASHATIKVEDDGQIYLLDQFSEHGTAVQRFESGCEERINGSPVMLQHGDTVRFGQRIFHVCLLAVRR